MDFLALRGAAAGKKQQQQLVRATHQQVLGQGLHTLNLTTSWQRPS
jgi:hypothetical protein